MLFLFPSYQQGYENDTQQDSYQDYQQRDQYQDQQQYQQQYQQPTDDYQSQQPNEQQQHDWDQPTSYRAENADEDYEAAADFVPETENARVDVHQSLSAVSFAAHSVHQPIEANGVLSARSQHHSPVANAASASFSHPIGSSISDSTTDGTLRHPAVGSVALAVHQDQDGPRKTKNNQCTIQWGK